MRSRRLPQWTPTLSPPEGPAFFGPVIMGSLPRRHRMVQHPTLEAAKVAGYVCFYDERVDTYVDGALQGRPRTPFS